MDFFHKLGEKIEKAVDETFHRGDHEEESQSQSEQVLSRPEQYGTQQQGSQENDGSANRFKSFAPPNNGNVKWHVDGASYFWAVSIALEEARESIYILDWWLSPELYLRRPPSRNEQYRLDNMLRAAAERGVQVNVIVYKEVTQALTLDSKHTKHALEDLHPNIKVFRHPDHIVTADAIQADIQQGFEGLSERMNSFHLSKVSGDALKSIYGTSDDMVLYWAHHEKLCIVDRKVAFMGGLDMCFGRWDTNSHPIADAHPGDLDAIIFPGQDYNNARVYDFEGVDNWDHNKLDRTKSSRMGWSDISISLNGPIVNNLLDHFTDRWNYIFDQKYNTKDPEKYLKVELQGAEVDQYDGPGANIQLCRSCTEWSAGHETEHSIQNAYISAITNAKHFVYMENQFFITATGDKQDPIKNQVGRAIVDRIARAHRDGEQFRIIVLMPAVPAFAGDLQSDGALGTRAIMQFQYNSINRGGHSIMEELQREGVDDPRRYITFYNLRNYDRINTSSTMGRVEREAGVGYETARREHDDMVGAGNYPYGEGSGVPDGGDGSQYERYQQATDSAPDLTWDSISACYMDGGVDINRVPWQGSPESEMNSFVSEELYIHSKVLIADDKLVICGSANMNDRSQLGTHDSEIAVVIEDPEPVETRMNGEPFTASKFAASLRRQLWRKHLGLLPHQRPDAPTHNTPINYGGVDYDWGSAADELVADPMSDEFWDLWTGTAKTNTDVFNHVFHPVPTNLVRTWEQYDSFFSRHFIVPGAEKDDEDEDAKRGKVDYGHVVTEEFPRGVEEVKEWLGKIRGTLVEMPLDFLCEVDDFAKKGVSFNSFTEDIYT